jgi:hypothetical protein
MDLENLFGQALEEKNIIHSTKISDKIIISTETEFGRDENLLLDEEASRLSEEESLKNKKKELISKFQKFKNVKNPKLIHVNEERSKKRKEIKKKISEIDLRLEEINMERKK